MVTGPSTAAASSVRQAATLTPRVSEENAAARFEKAVATAQTETSPTTSRQTLKLGSRSSSLARVPKRHDGGETSGDLELEEFGGDVQKEDGDPQVSAQGERSEPDVKAQLQLMFGTGNNGVYTASQIMAAMDEATVRKNDVEEEITGTEEGQTVSTSSAADTPVAQRAAQRRDWRIPDENGDFIEEAPVMPGAWPVEETPPEASPPDVPAPPATQVAKAGKGFVVPDIRLGVQARLRSGIYSEGARLTGLEDVLEQVPVESLKIGQPTWKSWGAAVGTKGNWHLLPEAVRQSVHSPGQAVQTLGKWANETITTSVRPREDLITTAAQYNLAFLSKQTAFQFKGSNLLKAAEQILFSDGGGSALYVIPRSAKIVGDAEAGNGKVVELTFSLGVNAETNVPLPEGEVAFFGEGADNRQGFARLEGDLTYTKLFTEVKGYPTAGIGPLAKLLPVGVRTEYRPEIPGQRTISSGEIVSHQFLAENRAILGQARFKIQFTVDGETAARLADFVKHPTVATIHDMAGRGVIKVFDEEGGFDPTLVRSWVPGHYVVGDGGLRLSAVNQKPSFKAMTDLTGRKTLEWDPEQTNLDVVFDDSLALPRKIAWLGPVFAPDRWLSLAGYAVTNWIDQKVTAVNDRLPSWLQFKGGLGRINEKLPSWLQWPTPLNLKITPSTHYLPTHGAVYQTMTGWNQQFGATSGTRYTLSVSTRNLDLIPGVKVLAGSVEARAQLKTGEQSVAPAIRKNGALRPREYTDEAGLKTVAQVPGWLSDLIDWSQRTRSHLVVPKGAHQSLTEYLDQIDGGSGPQAATGDFRSTLLPLFREPTQDNPNPAYTGFLSPRNLADVDEFLRTRAGPAS